MRTNAKLYLIVAAALSFSIAALHIVIIGIGPAAYLYFGAADMAQLSARGSWVPALLTWAITLVFIVFGVYALAGAGLVRGLPFVQLGLIVIGSVYTLRGLVLILDLVRLSRGAGYPDRQIVFSAVSLGVGLLYVVGGLARGGGSTEGPHAAG